jgi:hypothetical protein
VTTFLIFLLVTALLPSSALRAISTLSLLFSVIIAGVPTILLTIGITGEGQRVFKFFVASASRGPASPMATISARRTGPLTPVTQWLKWFQLRRRSLRTAIGSSQDTKSLHLQIQHMTLSRPGIRPSAVLRLAAVEEFLPLVITMFRPIVQLAVGFTLSLLTLLAHLLDLSRFISMGICTTPELHDLFVRLSVYMLKRVSPA